MAGRYLLQGVTEEAYADFSMALEASSGVFYLEISSSGGDTDVMWAFHDKLLCTRREVIGTAVGYCHSAAPLILAACSIRRCTPSTQFMVHEDICRLKGMPNKVMDIALRAQASEQKWYVAMERLSLISYEKWQEMSEAETYFDSKSAMACGLVDKILSIKRSGHK